MNAIGIAGPKGAGKDTIGQMIVSILQTRYNYKARTIAFADPIKKAVQHIFKLDPTSASMYDAFKRTDIEYTMSIEGGTRYTMVVPGRHVLREIGMLMREYDEKQFTHYVEREMEHNPDTTHVITDLRFDNEYVMLRRHMLPIIKIERPGYHYDGHITERGFDDALVDYVIANNGNLTDLFNNVSTIVDDLLKEYR